MTPRQFSFLYPANWSAVLEHGLHLHMGREFGTGMTLIIVSDEDRFMLSVRAPGHDEDDDDELNTDAPIVDRIGLAIANTFVRAPDLVDISKVPPWAWDATRRALDVHRARIEQAQALLRDPA